MTTLGVVALAGSPAAAAEHVVTQGENLSAIARRYRVSTAELIALNNLADPNHLVVGARLQLPSNAFGVNANKRTTRNRSSTARKRTAATPAAEHEPTFDLADAEQRKVAREIERAAVEFGVSPSLLKALTYTESRWRQDAVSVTGAVGIGQLAPETANWLAGLMGEPMLDPGRRTDNIRMSAFLLRWLLQHTHSTKAALASYYEGIGAVLRNGVTWSGARYAATVSARRRWFD